jgi:hypothetical protein
MYNETYKQIANTLHKRGYEVYVVGGAVRDSVQRNPIYEVDLATNAKQYELRELFFGHQIKTLGDFWTIIDGVPVITFFHKDYHHGEVTYEYTPSLGIFTRSLDFTVNSMVKTVTGELIDEHSGTRDMNRRILRTISDPDLVFTSEPHLMLRALYLVASTGYSFDYDCEQSFISHKHLLFTHPDTPLRLGEVLSKVFGRRVFSKFLYLLEKYDLTDLLLEGYTQLDQHLAPDSVDIPNALEATRAMIRAVEDKANPGMLLASLYLYSGLLHPQSELEATAPLESGLYPYQVSSAHYLRTKLSTMGVDQDLIHYASFLITFKGLFFGDNLSHSNIVSGLKLLSAYYPDKKLLSKMVSVLYTYSNNFCRVTNSERYSEEKPIFSENRYTINTVLRGMSE